MSMSKLNVTIWVQNMFFFKVRITNIFEASKSFIAYLWCNGSKISQKSTTNPKYGEHES